MYRRSSLRNSKKKTGEPVGLRKSREEKNHRGDVSKHDLKNLFPKEKLRHLSTKTETPQKGGGPRSPRPGGVFKRVEKLHSIGGVKALHDGIGTT